MEDAQRPVVRVLRGVRHGIAGVVDVARARADEYSRAVAHRRAHRAGTPEGLLQLVTAREQEAFGRRQRLHLRLEADSEALLEAGLSLAYRVGGAVGVAKLRGGVKGQ